MGLLDTVKGIFGEKEQKENPSLKMEPKKPEKTSTPHKPEPKSIDTKIHKKEWKVGDKLLDRYKIKKVLKGGMGVVYIALDHEWNQLFAIKTFQDKFLWNEDIINRFMEEAETWTNLESHTNIVFANFVREIEGKPLIFLEYLDGGDLSQFIGQMNIPQVLDFAIQFCTGMDYACNKLGVIHRDVKSGNVMVAKDKRFRFGYAFKVTDFGFVKALGKEYMEGLLESPSISTGMGTWPYMPPEQFSEEIQSKFSFKSTPITPRTDIYSFGVTFYEVLTRRRPFADVGEIFTKSPINPRLGEAWYNKGKALGNLGKYREAIECYDNALEVNPRIKEAWNNKENALTVLERYEEAIECYAKALEINPKDEKAWYNKGNAWYDLRRNEEATECYAKALEINPRLEEAWNNKGNALTVLERYEEAIECYDKTLEINPRDAAAENGKGLSLAQLGRFEEAITCFDKALEINPGYTNAKKAKEMLLQKVKGR